MKFGVEQLAGELRYLVDSDVRGKPAYLVDLEAYECNGACTCPNFQMRLEPKVRGGSRLRCKHILRARDVFADDVLKRIITERAKREHRKT